MATDDILHPPEHDPACDPHRWTSVVTAIRSYLHDIAGTFEDEISARPTREARIRRR
jgi:hypothetical protein